jgi:hypothetical protein
MKSTWLFPNGGIRLPGAALLGVGVAASTLSAAETNAPPAAAPVVMTSQEMFEGGTNTCNNWIELSAGGFITSGNKAQFQQMQQSVFGPFGGISDFHYQQSLDKNTTLSADGRALFDQHDYKLNLDVTREKLGFLRFSYQESRSWSSGDGGFYPPANLWFPMPGDALALDRGVISFEGGLRLEEAPNITFKYTHNSREGEEASTSWGYTHPAGGVIVQGLSPSFDDINERSDSFELDATHHIKTTDFGVGLRYESGKLDDALKVTQFPGETSAGQSIQQRVTDRQGTSYDMFNVHAFTETWLKQNVMFSTGFSYSDLDNDFSGSRIYGSDFDVAFVPNAQSDFGYRSLLGGSRLHEYVMDMNLLARLSKHLSIVPSLRVQKSDTDANFTGSETLGAYAPTPFNGNSDQNDLDVRERLDMSYTGITNWVFNARGEWTEGQGNLNERGGLGPVNGFGVTPIQCETDDRRFFQKYSLEARWYPARCVTVNVGGYYKINDYDYDSSVDSTTNNSANWYPAYLVMQNFETYDGNAGLTLRPWRNVTLVSRYEYQSSTIHTKPDPLTGLSGVESSAMTSHIIAQNVSWSPWSRLSLQAVFNYVLSETKTPVSDYTQAILNAQNNYWTLNFFSGLILDDKTDLNLNYFYYRADDYSNNSNVGVPYGAGAKEHGVTAAIVRRLTRNLRLTLKCGYYRYTDEPSGGNNNYEAYLLFSSLQYRF